MGMVGTKSPPWGRTGELGEVGRVGVWDWVDMLVMWDTRS